MVKVVHSISDLIGETPLLRLTKVAPPDAAEVYVKLESFNPGGSVKDRIALNMIEVAEQEGKLKKGDTIVEPTSGNTGVGLSMIGAAKGYKVLIVMPDTMSMERRQLAQAYGAELLLTPGADGIKASIAKAKELAEQDGYFMPMQFDNLANPAVHAATTGPEILEAFNGEAPDAFVAGVGTGGTLTGAGKVLKNVDPDITIYAVEPAESAVLSGEDPGSHKIQGIGTGFVPNVLDTVLYDKVVKVTSAEAAEMARRLAKEEGLLVGPSSGAAIKAAIDVAKTMKSSQRVVTVAPDNGERYLSTGVFNVEQ
ncbi:cysteine synthase A [Desemzia incerta]|uniref:Cysteine synthase n=1 Tax=Desemzia incerta TaxID=82801 RepID=A0A1I5YQG6_9LACT|nr:cysteine synthase A [Desemzia incerta]WHZ32946.1 cysteine synthase A [Desemzia incerta]SFQ46320.1 cysteine synthase [Desemzia incerta]